jgi:SulP family sulfate permease
MTDLQLESIKAIVDPNDEAPFTSEERAVFKQCQGQALYVHLGGPMSFGAANEMARKLTAYVLFQTLILDLSEVPMIDSSASLAVEEVIERALAGEREVLLVGIKPKVEQVLTKLGVIDLVPLEARFGDRLSALTHAAARIEARAQA